MTLQGLRDDTRATKEMTQAINTKAEKEVQATNRPKRQITKPAYLGDYV